MLKVDQKTIAEILDVTQQSIIRWEKEKGFPVIREDGKTPYYDVKECLKWYYKDDWKYYYSKLVEWEEEKEEEQKLEPIECLNIGCNYNKNQVCNHHIYCGGGDNEL